MLEILFNNIMAFPADIFNDILRFFKSLYDPNQNILENIFYNDFVWFGIGVWIWIKNGGQGCFYILLGLPIVWLVCKAIIIAFGIEFLFIILTAIILLTYLKNRNRNTKSNTD